MYRFWPGVVPFESGRRTVRKLDTDLHNPTNSILAVQTLAPGTACYRRIARWISETDCIVLNCVGTKLKFFPPILM